MTGLEQYEQGEQPFLGTFDVESCPVPTTTTDGGAVAVADAGDGRGHEVSPSFTG